MALRTPSPSSQDRWHPSRQRRDEAGFTLIELLVVIIILGILSAVVVFAVRGAGDKGQSAALTADAKTVRTAEEAYCAKFGSYADMNELVNKQFLSQPSVNTGVSLSSGGPCGTGPQSAYSMTASTAVINVAANADQWITSDTNSGKGYSSSAFVYPLNSNLNEPLILMNSDYTITGLLASSWERIPVGTNRNTVAGTPAGNPSTLPSTPTAYPTCNGIADRPFCTDTWRFHLRSGVKFHDGQAFDADDLIWTWRDRQPFSGSTADGENTLRFTRALTGAAAGCTSNLTLCGFDSVEKIDSLTVDFTPGIQNLRFPEQVLHPKGAIVEVLRDAGGTPIQAPAAQQTLGLSSPRNLGRHLDGSTDGIPAGTQNFGIAGSPQPVTPLVSGTPQGTGPFKYVSWNPTNPQGGGTASFLANPAYWGPNKAQVKGMNYTFIADPAVRTAGLQSGQYDMAIDLNPLDVAGLSNGGHVVTAPYGQNSLIYVNKVPKTSPNPVVTAYSGPATPAGYTFNITTDPAVRKAASLSLDRTSYIAAIFAGQAAVGRWMGPPNILGSYQNLVPALSFNLNLANSTLDTDGWTCGGAAPGGQTACAANEIRAWHGADVSKFATGRSLTLYMIGTVAVPQNGYDLMAAQMKVAGINLVTERAACDSGSSCTGGSTPRGRMYASSLWDFDVELPNQNDANAAFLPVLRQACTNESGNFRFAPADGTNGVSAAPLNDPDPSGGVYPFGNTPCTSPGAVLGPIDSPTITYTGGNLTNGFVAASNGATTQALNQEAAAQFMHVLVNQDQTNVVIPIAGQFRIYGLGAKMNLGDPHPSQTSQRWTSLSKTP